ncbi:hypothetical protein ACTD5D_08565 [Nocardia takedensis]|uniref:hypothetical protein n=1 Tax=Nocardia takedensis TaxID=259390 RepID=UPI0012F64D93|nr:hypothetical protein [Nocardia takedensis]
MGEQQQQSGRADPPFTERGYRLWRDRFETALPLEDPERRTEVPERVIEEAQVWYAAFLRTRLEPVRRRWLTSATRASLLILLLLGLCVAAGVQWRAHLWVVILCAVVAAAALYGYVSHLVAARTAFHVEYRTLTRQFPSARQLAVHR